MKNVRTRLTFAAAVLALLPAKNAFAAEGGMGPYTKGVSGFMAGVLPSAEGFYFGSTYYHFHGSTDAEVRGGVAEFGVGATLDGGLLEGIYVTDAHFLGATYAVSGVIDYLGLGLHASLDSPLGRRDINLDQNGVGDSFITPLMLGWNEGNFHYNFNFSVYVPTGSYDAGKLSIGKNYWAFMPQFGMTWYDPRSGWDVSAVATFMTMTKNNATDYQSGDMINLDWAVGWHFGAKQQWEIGIAGNLVEQIAGDSGSGAILGPMKAESAGIGPAISYNTTLGRTPASFSLKWEGDFEHRNTLGGDVVVASATFAF